MTSKPLKILWFTNTPSLASAYLKLPVIGGGWITSLEQNFKKISGSTLAIGFKHGNEELKKFQFENTTYYSIPDKESKYQKLKNAHTLKISNEDLVNYCLEIISDYQPDIINIFGTEEAFGLIANKTKIPVIIHLQGILTVYSLKWFSGNISKLDLIRFSGLKSFLKAESLLHAYYLFNKAAKRERDIFSIGNNFLGRTDWDKRVTAVLAPKANYYYGSEILRNEFYLTKWNKRNRKSKVFISTIQANIYKGLETVLETANLLTQLKLFDFRWVIVGIAENDIIAKVFEVKTGKKFRENGVQLIGKKQVQDLIELELNADIFIHPSHIDNSPNSVCEAMLLGMPVIATNSGGTGSLIQDKKEGLLIQDGDPYSMSGAIIELVNDIDFAESLGINARIRALKTHDPDMIVKNLENIYSKIINGSS